MGTSIQRFEDTQYESIYLKYSEQKPLKKKKSQLCLVFC